MDGIIESMSKLREMVKDREASCLQSMGSQRDAHNLATAQPQHIKTNISV